MKNIRKIFCLGIVLLSITSVKANAATLNSQIQPSDEINIEVSKDELERNSVQVSAVDGRTVDREAYVTYNGKRDSNGNSFSYSLTIKIPYTTYEDSSGKCIYSVDDDGISSYLSSNSSVREYQQSYATSKINKGGNSATIKGYGQVFVGWNNFSSAHDVDFKVTIYPNSGR